MKNIAVTVSYDEEKLSALKLYLEQKGSQVEDELTKALDTLYGKTVPAGVREYIELRTGSTEAAPKPKKPKPSLSSVVDAAPQEVKNNG